MPDRQEGVAAPGYVGRTCGGCGQFFEERDDLPVEMKGKCPHCERRSAASIAQEDGQLIGEAKLRAETIRADVRRYSRDSDAFASVEVLRRWNLEYLLDTADKLDALARAFEAKVFADYEDDRG